MSYNGTVRCGWCYQTGHNKRSCPEYTEILKQRALNEIQGGEGYEGYWGKMYNKRARAEGLYADGTKMSAEAVASKKQVRRCKYCNKQGHNRRTCPTLVADTKNFVTDQIDWRGKIQAWAQETGFGTGALLKVDRWGDCHAWLITGVNWNELNSNNVEHQSVVQVRSCRSRARDGHSLPRIDDLNPNSWSRAELVGSVPRVVFPENFLEESGVAKVAKEYFSDRHSNDFYDNYHS